MTRKKKIALQLGMTLIPVVQIATGHFPYQMHPGAHAPGPPLMFGQRPAGPAPSLRRFARRAPAPKVGGVIVSRLVVPGHRADMHEKALAAGADEVVFDLEDAVAAGGKEAAREQVAQTLARPEWSGRPVAVRVNAPGSAEQPADLAMCAAAGAAALSVVVPKVESPADVEAAAEVAPVQAIVESPLGLAVAAQVAAHPRVVALILGYADLAAALGRRGAERDPARWLVAQETLLAAARIGEAAAVDGPSFALRDTRAVGAEARAARELGYDGKWAIHPAQLEPINAAFAASAGERRWATRVREAVAAAGAGGGAAAALDGTMVDEAMLRRAERLLALPAAPEPPAPPEATHRVAAPYYDDLPSGADIRRARPHAHRWPRGAAPVDRGRQAAARARRRPVRGGDRARAGCSRIRCSSATWRSASRPRRACGCSATSSTAALAHVPSRSAPRCARPPRWWPAGRSRAAAASSRCACGRSTSTASRCSTSTAPRCSLPAATPRAATTSTLSASPWTPRALVPAGWSLEPLRRDPFGTLFAELSEGDTYADEAAETITAATELARMSLNIAHTHTDAGAGTHGERLVYGGHVIGIAAAPCHSDAPGPGHDPRLGVLRPPRPELRGRPAAHAHGDHRARTARRRWPGAVARAMYGQRRRRASRATCSTGG